MEYFDESLNTESLEIVDEKSIQLFPDAFTVYWSNTGKKHRQNSISIDGIIRLNSEFYREKFLSWIYELSEIKIKNNIKLKDYLNISDNLSYWWMTKIAEKNNYIKSESIDNCIRFFAFEDWAKNKKINTIYINTKNHLLINLFSKWCTENNIVFYSNKFNYIRVVGVLKKYLLYSEFLGILWLFQKIYIGLIFVGNGIEGWKKSKAEVTFISYFFNISKDSIDKIEFKSHYWGTLPEELNKLNVKTNWIHIHIKNNIISNLKVRNYLNGLNRQNNNQKHIILDSFISFNVIFGSIRLWLKTVLIFIEINKLIPERISKKSYLWELFESDFRESCTGKTCIQNLFTFKLFERAISMLPKQRKGFYLQENQPWEIGLINWWRNKKNGYIYGVPHATIRFWDLRYFNDKRFYLKDGSSNINQPDFIAINGPLAKSMLRTSGVPEDKLITVEALRYQYLLKQTEVSKNISNIDKSQLTILILGDYSRCITDKLIEVALKLNNYINGDIILSIKWHPNYAPKLESFAHSSIKNISIVNGSLDSALVAHNIAFCGSTTSASLDAYLMGMNVICYLDESEFNLSPLKDIDDVSFISDTESLAQAINECSNCNQKLSRPHHKYFEISSSCKFWMDIILN